MLHYARVRWLGVLLPLMFWTSAYAQDSWMLLARPTTQDLSRLCFLDSLSGWVVGRGGTILRTTDGGENWLSQNSGTTNGIMDIFMLSDRTGWCLAHQLPDTSGWYGTLILKTTDGGAEWTGRRLEGKFFTSITFLDSSVGWMGGLGGDLFSSTDGGATWTQAEVDSSTYYRLPVLRVKFASTEYGYAVGGWIDCCGVIWRTTNGGQRWTTSGSGGEPLRDIHFVDSLNILCIGGDLDFGAGIVRTTDRGVSWEYTYTGIFGEGTAMAFRTATEGWATLGFTGTVMYTRDTGRTWTEVYTFDTTAVYDVAFTDSMHGFMVGKRGTILRYNALSVDVDERSPLAGPSSSALHQNYPNPFNPNTNFTFRISPARLEGSTGAGGDFSAQGACLPDRQGSASGGGFVSLRIYDLLGREVATLIDEKKAPGTYHVTWDATGMASGVYFYALEAISASGVFRDVRKLVILR